MEQEADKGPRGWLGKARSSVQRSSAPAPLDLSGPSAEPDPERRPRTNALDDDRVRAVATTLGAAFVFVAVQQFFWPAPVGVLVQGAVIGGLTSLIAFGIALVYRSNRIINFAQGDLGAVPGSLAVLLIVGPGWPYFVALPAGILAAIALGVLVEFIIVRRFFSSPRLILTVATIAMTSLLAGMSLALPNFFDFDSPPQSFPSPFDFSFKIDPIFFRGNDIIAMITVPIVIGLLALFFRYTSVGIAVRASAVSADRAMLLGVPVKRIQMLVWVIATCLASTAIFMRAGIVGLPIGKVLGPAILVRALAACVIGRMENLPRIFAAAVALGIIEQAIIWETGRSILVAPVLFVVILGALLFQRRGIVARADDLSNWQAAGDVRPVPDELEGLPEVRWARRVGIALLVAFIVVLPALVSESRVNLVAVIMIISMVVISLVVLTGWAGQVSLGQIAFLGIGAAVGGAITERYAWDISIALLCAGVAGLLAAVIIGLPALRIKGLFLAVTTLAFAQATGTYFLSRDVIPWLPSTRLDRRPLFGLIAINTETRFYYFTFACLVLVIVGVNRLRRSRAGRVMIGVRENERGAQAYGINATTAKLTAFAVSGFIASFAGGLFVHHQQGLGIQPFGAEQSISAFIMVVVGGLGSVAGALLGAIWGRGGQYFFPAELVFFTQGIGLLFVLMVLPGGLGSLLYDGRDAYLRWVANRRRILVPSLIADARDLDAVGSGKEKGLEFLRDMTDQFARGEIPAPDADSPVESVEEQYQVTPEAGEPRRRRRRGRDEEEVLR